jgi:hypothetical protein
MPHRIRLKQHPALKHGAYSALAVLPGEDRAEFEKLHRDLIAEYSASGPLEHHYVAELARFIWRLQNLGTLRVANLHANLPSAQKDSPPGILKFHLTLRKFRPHNAQQQ